MGTRQGAQVAINADFFRSAPTRVYGEAIGNGFHGTINQDWTVATRMNGIIIDLDGLLLDTIGRVQLFGMGQTKSAGVSHVGWLGMTTIPPPAPDGTIALISGFPSLVIEGQVYTYLLLQHTSFQIERICEAVIPVRQWGFRKIKIRCTW